MSTSTDVTREEFGATQLEVVRETAAAAVAAREKAAVEARYIVAMRQRRKIEITRQELLKSCRHPDFAEAAWYKRPAGRAKNKKTGQWEDTYAEGFSIRFAEEALRCFGNVYPEMSVVFESDDTRIVRVTVTDLEANLPYSTEIVIRKQVERKKLKEGQVAVGQRINSSGDPVFIVEATDDEILSKQNALRSKSIRTDGLRLIPAWLKAECKREIFEAMEGQVKNDPDAAKRRIIDSFSALGITVTDIEEYLGHQIERIAPKEIVDLRTLYTALKDNEISWDEAMESRSPSPEERSGSKEAAQKVAEEKLRKAKEGQPAKEAEAESESEPNAKAEHTQRGQNRGFSFGGGKK